MKSIACDVVLLPSVELADKAITASKQLGKYDTLFTLGEAGPYPHTSLYMTQLREDRLAEAETLLAAIAANTAAMTLVADRYDQAEGFIDANYQRFSALDELQRHVINALNPIRDGMHESAKARLSTATGLERYNLETFGYRHVGELFRPHLTLSRFMGGNAIDTRNLPEPNTFSGLFGSLALFEMGDSNTCVRKIAEFSLAGSVAALGR